MRFGKKMEIKVKIKQNTCKIKTIRKHRNKKHEDKNIVNKKKNICFYRKQPKNPIFF
jgi:hypothetical protein